MVLRPNESAFLIKDFCYNNVCPVNKLFTKKHMPLFLVNKNDLLGNHDFE